MKKKTKIIVNEILILAALLLLVTTSTAQNLNSIKLTKLGLVSELAHSKLSVENHFTQLFGDSTISNKEKLKLVSDYLSLKTIYDQILLELIADGVRINRIRHFKKLDKALYKNEIQSINQNDYRGKLKSYIGNLILANEQTRKFLEPNPYKNSEIIAPGFFPAAASVAELTGVLSLVTSIVKDVREARGKKVDAINKILNELRLSPIQELSKPKEKTDKVSKVNSRLENFLRLINGIC